MKLHKKINEKQIILLLLLSIVILISFIIRFYNISNVGISQVDEAIYMLEANWINNNDFSHLEYPLSGSKPLFSYLISLSIRLFGDNDFSGIMVSAIFGCLTVLIIFLIGYFAYNAKIGLIASILIAFNKLHIAYSRNIYAESTMLFFLSLSILFYILSNKYKQKFVFLLFCGISIGLSYDAKFLGLILLPIIIFFEIYNGFKTKKIYISIKNILMVVLGFLTIFFLTWFLYYLAGESYLFYFLHRIDQIYFGKIFIEAIPFLNEIPRYPSDWFAGGNFINENLAYLFYFYKTFNFIMLGFLFIGLYIIIKRKKKFDLLFIISILLCLLLIVITAYGRPRTLMFFPTLFVIISSIGISAIYNIQFRKNKINENGANLIIIVLVFFIAISGLINSMDVIKYENQVFKQTADFLKDKEFNGTISTSRSIISYYTKKETIGNFECNDLENYYLKGYNYIIIDTWKIKDAESFNEQNSCYLYIFQNMIPIKTINFEIQEWQFPIKEVYYLKMIDNMFNNSKIHYIVNKIDKSFLTKSKNQQVLIYRSEDVLFQISNSSIFTDK